MIPALTRDELAALHGSQRSETWRFELLDRDLVPIGELGVSSDRPPTIENNMNRTIKRQMNGAFLAPGEADEVDPLQHRVRATMILGGEYEFPLGVFLFSGWDRSVTSAGTVPAPTLHDQNVILDQPVPATWTNRPGTTVTSNLERMLRSLPLPYGWEIESNTARISSAGQSWPAGTSRSTILTETAALASFSSGYFDNNGVLRFEEPSRLTVNTEPDFDYDEEPSRVVADSIVLSDDLLDAPNRYIVIDTSSPETPRVGVYNVPDSAPQSAANRGFVIARTYEVQGVSSVAQARRMAESKYRAERGYEWVSFEAGIDPRHDTFDSVRILGQVYRSQSWTMRCSPGAPMRHQLRRTYG